MSPTQLLIERSLPKGTVDVWVLSVPPGRSDAGLDLLDSNERARWHSFRFHKDRRLYSCAHALLRSALSAYTTVDPRDWKFQTGPWGRPELAGPLENVDLRFSLSHTGGLAVCAIARGHSIGIDVELINDSFDLMAIAQLNFTGSECAQIASAPAHLKPEVFCSVWTLKEAYVKARGLGLSLPLKSFSVTVAPPSIRPTADDWPHWYASLSRHEGPYLLAVAMPSVWCSEPPTISYRRFSHRRLDDYNASRDGEAAREASDQNQT
jgi:4'-phosphopantetheinyl transferase